MTGYNHAEIEAKWQQRWVDDEIAKVDLDAPGEKLYMLMMFPYPSGDRLHVGHGRNYILGDAVYRYCRMNGRQALNPMGWDAFGLPAENAAIKLGVHPRDSTLANIGSDEGAVPSLGDSLRLVEGTRLMRTRLLSVEPVALPPDAGEGDRL